MRVLVSAASRNGSTREIAEAIAATLREHGLEAVVADPADVAAAEEYDAAVIGSAVYAGHWLPEAKGLVARAGRELSRRPVWLFSSGPVGRPSGRFARAMAAEEPRELADVSATLHAREHRVFAGRLRSSDLHGLQRLAAAVFRSILGDFRDWDAIGGWAAGIAWSLREAEEAGEPVGVLDSARPVPGMAAAAGAGAGRP